MNTIACYDRRAGLTRSIAAIAVITGMAAGLVLGLGVRAQPSPVAVQKLPTVVMNGKSVKSADAADAEVQIERLPTVVVSGKRSVDGEQLAQR
ncbi:hypothetical protein LZ017_16825 [Pelomonas sp. CA6]|uniref:hypothetical protein n=1 Tax=Pelomonas sp. CA6 TaxID=2907999 RepID=UPI001F4C321E|nr:hypothetical protein [Pelomonas sp. CA6]MCH7345048.1 hypothetical protein [Pelomonas sp. CA6]